MLIGIEASRANRLQKTGVEWYAYHLIQSLKTLPESSAYSWQLFSEAPLAMGLENGPVNWHETRLSWPLKYLWTQFRLSYEMWRRRPDVLFVPAHVLPRVIPKRTVVTIHDIGFHRLPQLYKPIQRLYHEWSTRDIVRRVSKILTVSEFSKQEIVDAYGVDPQRIHVTYLGINHERYRPMDEEASQSTLRTFHLHQPFLLFIGRWENKKNVVGLVKAFYQYKETRGIDDPLQLVLVGQNGVGFEEIGRTIVEGAFADRIHLIGYVTEQEKVALLSSAVALVHPSYYEGFGLTPLEAMACGCPVICSRAASLPEVVGIENALWFEPHDVTGLADRIARLVDHPDMRQALRERGLVWCQRYSWEQTARQTLSHLTTW